jgi:carboxyl-terminal processing protease
MKIMRRLAIVLCSVLISSASIFAQSKNFDIGQSLDIQMSILKHLSNEYVDTVDMKKLIETGVKAMLSSLDPYTIYYPEELESDIEMMTTGMYGGIGAIIKKRPGEAIVINEPYVGTPAVKFGLQPGDSLIAINGEPVYDLTSQQGSNKMKGQPGTDVKFTIIKGRTREKVDVVVTRERIHISNIQYYGMLNDTTGYVHITGFTDKMSQELKDAVLELKGKGMSRLVLDLRGNGGGLMGEAVDMLSLFLPRGTMVVSSKGRTDAINQSSYTANDPIDVNIPILVMVDNGSASSAEIVAGALQDLDRATIAGKRTFGKGLIQSIRPVSYNGSVKLTTGKYYTPSGRCVQAIDYSHRNSDGSVGAIPDSLTKEFKTAKGRVVKDGGGITPDIEVDAPKYSRPTYSLVLNDIIGEYAINYYVAHEKIVPVEDFKLTDEEFKEFVDFAKSKDFDCRGNLKAQVDNFIKSAKEEKIYDSCKAEIDALLAKVDLDKETLLNSLKGEIVPLIEEEIVTKYYFASAASIIGLRTDTQLQKALAQWK